MLGRPGRSGAISVSTGSGRLRARSVTIGASLIAIENIGTIRIVRGQRSWGLFLLGVVVIAAASTQLSAFGVNAIAGIALGVVLMLVNLAQRVESGLSIGTADGQTTLIVSRNEVFLQRLLQLLTDRIDTGDETLLASFDIANATISLAARSVAADARAQVSAMPSAAQPTAPAPGREPADAADDALFADFEPEEDASPDDGQSAVPPQPAPAVVRVRTRSETHRVQDPLLDGPPRTRDGDDDWLARPRVAAPPQDDSDGGAMRVLLALLILVLIGAGVFAAWYLTGQTGPVTTISLIASPPEPIAAAAPSREPAEAEVGSPAPVEAPVQMVEDPAAPPAEIAASPPTSSVEVEDYIPPGAMVARASGLRYRERPAADDDVAVVAETRAGGEALRINGRTRQPDGEWYRVSLADDRTAWFKASLALPRERFAQSISLVTEAPGVSFAASTPQVLEPAEGAQFGGGAQPVLLAWSHRGDAARFIVEIEAFDGQTLRWIQNPQHRRIVVEEGAEVSEDFPAPGAWRWRVRGVTADGQQSQVSRWAAFTLRN